MTRNYAGTVQKYITMTGQKDRVTPRAGVKEGPVRKKRGLTTRESRGNGKLEKAR